MNLEQKEQRDFFEVALFFLSLQISRECVTMEARKDPDGVRRERLSLRRERDPAGKDDGGGSGPPLLHVGRTDPRGRDRREREHEHLPLPVRRGSGRRTGQEQQPEVLLPV